VLSKPRLTAGEDSPVVIASVRVTNPVVRKYVETATQPVPAKAHESRRIERRS
jgi:hypothetical protein